MGKLVLDWEKVSKARMLANEIAGEVYQKLIRHNTTISVERSVLRLMGVDGVDRYGVPLPNVVAGRLKEEGLLGRGSAFYMAAAALATGLSVREIADQAAGGSISFTGLPNKDEGAVVEKAFELCRAGAEKIAACREKRREMIKSLGDPPQPYLYVIVATGNIYEDAVQARAAVRQGADIIAVIRSTGQSLLDYVPYGPTTEGFGGTLATQANFSMMREALDQAAGEAGRYIRLANYASGLCMPEIAAMGSLERLDVMLNDCMYGIIFRDINMQRTFVDQHFSRMINAYAGIIINTGEDNYLTTADAFESAHTVLASNFINERFALMSGLKEEQTGLGHAMEINPEMEDSFLYELAQARLIREIFPKSPIKYMPPTKHISGNIFRGHVQDSLFNAVSVMTGQGIHLLGMLTEAIHTPLLQDRYLSIESCKLVFNAMRNIGDEIYFRQGGRVQRRVEEVLDNAVKMLEKIRSMGLMEALSRGMFAEIRRSPDGGKGLGGVIKKEPDYLNPFPDIFNMGGIR
ncbi:MAG: lysine 5,6-aminomutase subunit alpha [Bacillota bacterium]